MAFNPAPNSWIASWNADATHVQIPIASLPELLAEEADALEGDFRKCLFAILDQVWDHWNLLPEADRPLKMVMRRQTITDDEAGTQDRSYTVTFTTANTTEEVVSE
jgi:hypothetical protein